MILQRKTVAETDDDCISSSSYRLETLQLLKKVKLIKRNRLQGQLQKRITHINGLELKLQDRQARFEESEKRRENQIEETLLAVTASVTRVEELYAAHDAVNQIKVRSIEDKQDIQRLKSEIETHIGEQQSISNELVMAEKALEKVQFLIGAEVIDEP